VHFYNLLIYKCKKTFYKLAKDLLNKKPKAGEKDNYIKNENALPGLKKMDYFDLIGIVCSLMALIEVCLV
jgi:hypothetical protein